LQPQRQARATGPGWLLSRLDGGGKCALCQARSPADQALAQHGGSGFDRALPRARGRRWLADGDTAQIGKSSLHVRHCPNHTPGHVVFHSPQSKRAFVGDVLFAGSIGRTDFPQGNHDQLIGSIPQRLWPWGMARCPFLGTGRRARSRRSGGPTRMFDSVDRLPQALSPPQDFPRVSIPRTERCVHLTIWLGLLGNSPPFRCNARRLQKPQKRS